MLTKKKLPDDIKALFTELIFEKASGYFVDYITLPSQSDQYLFANLSKTLDVYLTYDYEKVLIAGLSLQLY